MRIPALLPPAFDFFDFFARFFAMARRAAFLDADDLRLADAHLPLRNYLTTRMVQKSCASSGSRTYS